MSLSLETWPSSYETVVALRGLWTWLTVSEMVEGGRTARAERACHSCDALIGLTECSSIHVASPLSGPL